MQRVAAARRILILALVIVFGLFGLGKFLSPEIWIGWIPLWMEGLLGFSRNVWMQVIGGLEILFALALLIPVRRLRQIAALLMALHVIAILTQIGWNDIAIRDTGLLLSSVALLVLL